MRISHSTTHNDALSLEAAAVIARSGFACIFSCSDEYERALISQRRAQGRYAVCNRTMKTFIALAITAAGVVAYWV
jgi:hypothetical protein